MSKANQPIPCQVPWCLADHTDRSAHERQTLDQEFAEVAAELTRRPAIDGDRGPWIRAEINDPENLLSPAEARTIAYALLQAAAILETTPVATKDLS